MKINISNTVLTVFALTLAFNVTANAQKKKPAPKSAPATATSTDVADVKSGAANTATELKKVIKFVYLLGGIAQGIEDIDTQAKAGKTSKAIIDQNEQFKQSVITSIRNLGAGLAALEVEFRTKAGLRPYASKVDGITRRSGIAEDLASTGKFKDAGRELLGLVEQLTDVLVTLP